MTRLMQAWLALCGKQPATQVFSECVVAKAYVVTDWRYNVGGGMVHRFPKSRRFYETCTQAYASEAGRTVEEWTVLKAGGKVYVLPNSAWVREIRLQPKPKVAKGKKKAAQTDSGGSGGE